MLPPLTASSPIAAPLGMPAQTSLLASSRLNEKITGVFNEIKTFQLPGASAEKERVANPLPEKSIARMLADKSMTEIDDDKIMEGNIEAVLHGTKLKIASSVLKNAIVIKKYRSSSGRTLAVLPKANESQCGISCALMLALDSLLSFHDEKFDCAKSSLTNWFYTGKTKEVLSLENILSSNGFSTFILKFHNTASAPHTIASYDKLVFYDPKILTDGFSILEAIKQVIEADKTSVMINIDRPINTLWIIIDYIDEKEAEIRDPVSGHAHRVDKNILASLLYSKIYPCNIIYGIYVL